MAQTVTPYLLYSSCEDALEVYQLAADMGRGLRQRTSA